MFSFLFSFYPLRIEMPEIAACVCACFFVFFLNACDFFYSVTRVNYGDDVIYGLMHCIRFSAEFCTY